jgi:uncharacterized membrane protein
MSTDPIAHAGELMRRVWNTFIKGLAAVLPVAITIYLVVWLATTAENMLGAALRLVLPQEHYRPGLGLGSLSSCWSVLP